jgi:adenosyl cobinamide kinase/adenosyl cobinamide phosphate guanylyltransferase
MPRPDGSVPRVRTLVLGGARSGKSAHAEGLLTDASATYLATARRDPADADWAQRIALHEARRPKSWRTVETADVAAFLRDAQPDDPPILVDDVATWLTGELDDANAWDGPIEPVRARADELVDAVSECPARLVLVSAEVGLGVVPPTRSGRLFRDELGALNAALAQACTDVLLLVAGLPLVLKQERWTG